MKIERIAYQRIRFVKTTYDPKLKASLLRMGQGFPLQVKTDENGNMICIDGAKRLSAISDIVQENPAHRLAYVKVIIQNHARTASTQAKNHH